MIYQPKCFTVHSGELLIGVISEIAHAPNAGQWTWALSGTRPNPPGFIWRGQERTTRRGAPRARRMLGRVAALGGA